MITTVSAERKRVRPTLHPPAPSPGLWEKGGIARWAPTRNLADDTAVRQNPTSPKTDWGR